jgi:hypothetical protein
MCDNLMQQSETFRNASSADAVERKMKMLEIMNARKHPQATE